MKKTILTFGLIAGLVVSALMLASITLLNPEHMLETGMWLGYASMIIALSMVYVGVKNYRDKYSDGFISFGKALQTGLFITLIASTIYVISWVIYNNLFMPDFMEKYAALALNKLKAEGASASEIAKQSAEMAQFSEMYKNPFVKIMFTYLEILPVGIIISLLSALILKRKPGLKIAG